MKSVLAIQAVRLVAVRSKILLLAAAVFFAGCSANPLYKSTGAVLAGYAEGEATPYVLQMSDPDMACALGESIDPLLYSFSRVNDAPDTTGSLMMSLASNCMEYKAWEAELTYLRAAHEGNTSAAIDASEQAKRLYANTAKRRLVSFRRAMAAYNFNPATEVPECPFFLTDQDEMTFMLGLLTGLQAVVNDDKSGDRAAVPSNIAPQIERAATCVDNEKLVGLPNAVRAMVWLMMPDTRPELSPEPWRVFKHSSSMGVRAGTRAALALEAVAADILDQPDMLADAIHRFAEADETMDVWDEYRLIDSIAARNIRFSSDKHWIAEYGHRTPEMYFGKMSPERSTGNTETMSLDGLL